MKIINDFIRYNRHQSKRLVIKHPVFFKSSSYKNELLKRIDMSIASGKVKTILEAGGIDRPLLKKHRNFLYAGLDIEEKDNCYEVYDKFFVQSIEDEVPEKFDLVISITLLEHVPDNHKSIKSIYSALNKNGETHHYLPSKWHPYAMALRLVGPIVQKKLIPVLRPGAESVTGYPAYFNHCSVPSMIKLMKKQGFKNITTRSFYRANDYFAFFVPFFIVVTAFENLCEKMNWQIFASGFIISAKKE